MERMGTNETYATATRATATRVTATHGGTRWRQLALGLLALLGLAVISTRGYAAGLLIADGGLGGVLEIQEQTVDVTINNGIAVTKVNQVFRNTENRQVEALYTFPVPKAASVSNFSMWIDGKEVIGEVLEKKRAREIYDSYKAKKKDPGLLEQVDYKTFEMRIYPINPGAEQRVQIAYYQELDYDHDTATYVYPLMTVTRRDLNTQAKGRFGLTLRAKSEVPIVEIGSPSHGKDFVITQQSESLVQASLETAGGDLNRDVVLRYKVARPKTGLDLITSRGEGEDGYFSLTLTAGKELEQLRGGMDYVFVLDISGSMGAEGKLDVSRNSVAAFIQALGPEDRFEVMSFNVAPTPLFQKLVTADDPSKAQATKFFGEQQAKGGTILRPVIEAAYRYAGSAPTTGTQAMTSERPLNVVLLSDGMSEPQERTELLALIGRKPAGVKVFCIGVGNEVNRPLLTQMAEDAGGLAAFVSQGDDFAKQAEAFRRKLTHPVASNLKIDFAGGSVYDLEPQKLPDLYYGAPVRLYGRYKQAGPLKLTVKAEVLGKPIETAADLKLPERDETNPEIERMWAWRRVERLLGEADRTGSRQGVTDEIVRLGEAYSIATEYTSFLVLENDAEYQRWKIERRNALRIDRDRRQQDKLRASMEQMNEKMLAKLGPAPAGAPGKEAADKLAGAPGVVPGDAPEVLYEGQPNPASAAAPAAAPAASAPVRPVTPAAPVAGRNVDLALPHMGGGGAFDPISGGIALTLGALTLFGRKGRRPRK